MKRGTPDHPKTLDLAEALYAHFCGARLDAFSFGVCHSLAVGLLERLWHYTARYAPAGDIGKHSDVRIAQAVGWPDEPAVLIAILVATKWLDECADAQLRLLVHDWSAHSDETCDRYLASHGLLYADGSRPRSKSYARRRRSRARGDPVATGSRQPKPEPEPEPNPPPSAPSPSVASAVAAAGGGDGGGGDFGDWTDAERALAAVGVVDAVTAVRNARQRGLDPAEVFALIEYWQSRPGSWGPGALQYRIRVGVADQRCDEGWPPPDKKAASQKRERKEAIARQAESEALEKQLADEHREQAELERRWGGRVDALQEGEALELLNNNLLRERYRKLGKTASVRDALLRAVATQGAPP